MKKSHYILSEFFGGGTCIAILGLHEVWALRLDTPD